MSEAIMNECEICLDDKCNFWSCDVCKKLVCLDCKVLIPIKELYFNCPYCRTKHYIELPDFKKMKNCCGIINCFLYSIGLHNNKYLWTDGNILLSKSLIIGITTNDGYKHFGNYTTNNLGSVCYSTSVHIKKCRNEVDNCLFKNIKFHNNLDSWIELMNNGDILFNN